MSDFNYKQSFYYATVMNSLGKVAPEERERVIEDLKKDFPILSMDTLSPVGICILDFSTGKYPYISQSIESVLGYGPEDFHREGMKLVIDRTHPDDVDVTANQMTRLMWEKIQTIRMDMLTQYRFSFNYRFRRKDGKYIHLLQQSTAACVDDSGKPMIGVTTVSDISFLKKDNSIMLQISKYDKKKGVWKEAEMLLNSVNNPLSVRESQVLRGLAHEKSNEEIAESLGISVNTVRAHRRNILASIKCKTTNSAISLAHREGWI